MNRSQRCGVCRGCQAKPCGNCTYCQDSPQFGGPGVKKQSCIERRCLRVLENRLQRDAPTFKAKAGCNQCDDCRVADCQVCLVCLDKRFFENRHMTGAMCAKKRCNNARTIELPMSYPPQNGTPNHNNGNSNGTDSPNGLHGGVYAEVFHNRQQAPPNGVHHTPQPQMIGLKRPSEPMSVMDGAAQAKLQRRPFPGASQPGANTQTVAVTHQPILPLPTKMVPLTANGHGGYPQQPYVATVVQVPVVGLQQQAMPPHYAFSQPVQLIAAPQPNHPTMANQPLVGAPAPPHSHHQLSNGNGSLSLNSSAPSTLLSTSLVDASATHHQSHHHHLHQGLASWTNGASDVFEEATAQQNVCDPFLPPSYAPGKNAVVLQQL